MTINYLSVFWTPPEGTRFLIGSLWRSPDSSKFYFQYRLDLSSAMESGFRGLVEFPDLDRVEPYSATYLFPTFSKRIPSKRRPDFQRMMEDWNVKDPDDPFEILAANKGKMMTDHITVAEETR